MDLTPQPDDFNGLRTINNPKMNLRKQFQLK